MAIAASSSSSSLFSTFKSSSPSQPIPRLSNQNLQFKRTTVTAAYATAERPTTNETMRSFRTSNSSSLYDVLGVGIGADMREIKSAYRRLARVLHPDVGNGDSSADEFMKVHSAYSTLADPEKRAVYDRSLVQRRMGGLSPVMSGGGYRSRRWETDQCW